jgi:hypothetical protein
VNDFEKVGLFHQKFGVRHASIFRPEDSGPAPRLLSPEEAKFRIKFLREELEEFEEGVREGDLAKCADALVDLVYVALGTAHMQMLPWDELFAEVQRANMTKERCGIDHLYRSCLQGGPDHVGKHCGVLVEWPEGTKTECAQAEVKHSRRGSALDVIKPEGWTPPQIEEVLAGWIAVSDSKADLRG